MLKSMAHAVACALPAVLFVGCTADARQPVAPDRSFIVRFEPDPERRALYERARATLDDFRAALRTPAPSFKEFGLRVGFRDGERVEHLWVTDLEMVGPDFEGQLATAPNALRSVQLGQRFVVRAAEIEDWLYWDGQRRVGGFTVGAAIERRANRAKPASPTSRLTR